jgi:hypothetical protein
VAQGRGRQVAGLKSRPPDLKNGALAPRVSALFRADKFADLPAKTILHASLALHRSMKLTSEPALQNSRQSGLHVGILYTSVFG